MPWNPRRLHQPARHRPVRVLILGLSTLWRRRWLETFDWYTASYQWSLQPLEVSRWFQSNGFTDVEIGMGSVYVRGKKADAAADVLAEARSHEAVPVRVVAQR